MSTDKQGKSGLRAEARREAVGCEALGEYVEITGKGADTLDRRPQPAAARKVKAALAQKKANGIVLGNRTNFADASAKRADANRAAADAFAANGTCQQL